MQGWWQIARSRAEFEYRTTEGAELGIFPFCNPHTCCGQEQLEVSKNWPFLSRLRPTTQTYERHLGLPPFLPLPPQHSLSGASSREQCRIRLCPQQLSGQPLSSPCLDFLICKVGTDGSSGFRQPCVTCGTLWQRPFSPGPTWAGSRPQWAGGGPRKLSRTSQARGLSPQRTSSSDPKCPSTPVPLWNSASELSNARKYVHFTDA